MATRKLATVVDEVDAPKPPTEEFLVEKVRVRGVTYYIRELTSKEYDGLLKQATTEDETDMQLLAKLMTLKAVMKPELDAEAWADRPMPVVRAVQQKVTGMHWGQLEEDSGNS